MTRSQFSTKSLLWLTALLLFFLVLSVVTGVSLHCADKRIWIIDDDDVWLVWMWENGLRLSIHHRQSPDFWETCPIVIRYEPGRPAVRRIP